MATSSTSLFVIEPLLNVDLTKKYGVATSVADDGGGTESKYVYWPGQRVKLNNGCVAIFTFVGSGGISVSASCTTETVNGTTITASTAGIYISMNAVSASAGEWVWVRSSGPSIVP